MSCGDHVVSTSAGWYSSLVNVYMIFSQCGFALEPMYCGAKENHGMVAFILLSIRMPFLCAKLASQREMDAKIEAEKRKKDKLLRLKAKEERLKRKRGAERRVLERLNAQDEALHRFQIGKIADKMKENGLQPPLCIQGDGTVSVMSLKDLSLVLKLLLGGDTVDGDVEAEYDNDCGRLIEKIDDLIGRID